MDEMKPIILLLHGALGSKDQFGNLKKYLSQSYEVVDFNFSGHGGKPFNLDTFSINGFTSEILMFLEENKISEISIFGYSMGGYVALDLALKSPEKVEKIFTLGTKFQWSPEIASKEVKMLDPEIIEAKVPKFAFALQKRHAPNDWKKVLNKTVQMMTELGNGKAIPLNEFSKIEKQVIIGLGELDNMVSKEESLKVSKLLPNGVLELFDGFKHPIEQTDPQTLAKRILLHFKETNI